MVSARLMNCKVVYYCPHVQYYYEPETGQKFRSRIAAQRYLAEMRENVPLSSTLEELKENKPLSKMFKLYHDAKVS